VTEQINQARVRLDLPPDAATATAPAPAPAAAGGWPGLEISVDLGASAATAMPQVPAGAVLFVVARQEGSAGGPPLGVRRIAQPVFPVQLTLTDSDSMMPQRPISGSSSITLQARLSLTGEAAPAAGDWQSVQVTVATGSDMATQLTLDQKVE
jgi:cytochrome c-type biogenesis protein CcmH